VTASLQIGDALAKQDIAPGAKEIVFNIKLKHGKTRLTAMFLTDSGEEYGAYYAYVNKK
jgi:hypothetical protein